MGSMNADHEDHSQARPAEPIVTYERPLTPKEAADLGMAPGPGFADGVREALAKAPVVIVSGPLYAAAADDEDADIAYPIRHHARRFVMFFAFFVVVSIVNIMTMILGIHGLPSFAAVVGIVFSVPAFLYHEVKLFRAGGRIGDAFDVVRGLLGRKEKS